MASTEIIDCTTCKYGYEDERLGIPMCHHPKRFSEDCVDFNMHEEKEIEESEKPVHADISSRDYCSVRDDFDLDGNLKQKTAGRSEEVRFIFHEKEVASTDSELEEASRTYAKQDKWMYEHFGDVIMKAFSFGSKWQAEKDARDMYMSDNRHFEKVYQLGKKDMKEQMLKEAVEGEITKDNRGNNVVRAGVFNKDFEYGDKVRIIVIKE